jgi:hypothetical protein
LQTAVLPLIVPGCAGTEVVVTASVCAVLLPQVFDAVTETFPLVEPVVTVMEFVVEVPVHPEGNVHAYAVAPDTAAMEYVCAVPEHTAALPLIVPGCAGTEQLPVQFVKHAALFTLLMISAVG